MQERGEAGDRRKHVRDDAEGASEGGDHACPCTARQGVTVLSVEGDCAHVTFDLGTAKDSGFRAAMGAMTCASVAA